MTRKVTVALGAGLLLVGTALVSHAFDSHSHSASDTLRPFLLTIAPVWCVSVLGARVLLRRT